MIENLGKLKRRITICLAKDIIKQDVECKLRTAIKKVTLPGFRRGKVPMNLIRLKYEKKYESEVLNDKINHNFYALIKNLNIRIFGQPNFTLVENNNKQIVFNVTFEVYPEVKIGDIKLVNLEKIMTDIGNEEIEYTINILRKQHASFYENNITNNSCPADGDRVTIDFIGKIDNLLFKDSSAVDFMFVLGEGCMLPIFETQIKKLKVGETCNFNVTFPNNYNNFSAAGKTAIFNLLLKRREVPNYPEVNSEFAKLLGISDGNIKKMRKEIHDNLCREVKYRSQIFLKNQVMNILLRNTQLDVPNILVEQEQKNLLKVTQQTLKKYSITKQLFSSKKIEQEAERRVKLGFIIKELVSQHNLKATLKQIQNTIEEFSKNYENPAKVVNWYNSSAERLAEIENYITENNVVDYITSLVKVTTRKICFQELAKITMNNTNNS